MIYECIDRAGKRYEHTLSDELHPREAMQRLDVLDRPFTVTRWPTGRPDLARVVQHMPTPTEGHDNPNLPSVRP